MDEKASCRAFRVSALIGTLALVFTLFFQLSKREPFRDVNPFLEDPYDAIGSIAFQVALLVGALTFARSLRVLHAEAPETHLRLVGRGNLLVLGSVIVTLLGDALAVALNPAAPSAPANELRLALVGMCLFTVTCASGFAAFFPRVPHTCPEGELTPADGIDDLAALIRIPLTRAGVGLPVWLRMGRRPSDAIFSRFAWLNPRIHPWRFACALGLSSGAVVAALQLREGPSSTLAATVIIAALFVSIEFTATVAGFALIGAYLGLRPPSAPKKERPSQRCHPGNDPVRSRSCS